MNDAMPVVLLVEDEPQIRRFTGLALKAEGWQVFEVDTLRRGLIEAGTRTPDMVVLDLGLPDGDGVDFIEDVRKWSAVPIIVLSARTNEADKIRALDAGADDYLTKPFRLEELVLRLQVLIRRAAGHAGGEVRAGPLALDTATGVITLNGLALKLTAFESRLLRLLLLHKGRTVSRTDMVEQMYDGDADRDFRSLEVVMGRLRRKLGEGRIETVRGEGYRLLDQEAA